MVSVSQQSGQALIEAQIDVRLLALELDRHPTVRSNPKLREAVKGILRANGRGTVNAVVALFPRDHLGDLTPPEAA